MSIPQHRARLKYHLLILFSLQICLLIIASADESNQTIEVMDCFCDQCENDTCRIDPDPHSYCFKSVRGTYLRIDGAYVLETSYGCMSSYKENLGGMQCRANTLKHTEPIFLACCRDKDNCNLDLPDPTELDDPRWKFIRPPDIHWSGLHQGTVTMIFVITLLVLVLCLVILLSRYFSRSSKKSNTSSSVCTSKADLDKDISHIDPHHLNQSTRSHGGTTSSHTYSIIEDPCGKPDHLSDNPDLLPGELTSGLGEHMLNQRTLARAIGSGETDPVGSGRFGRVFRGSYHGEDVAVKAFRGVDQDSWRREDTIFRYLNHENIVRFIASQVTAVSSATTEIWMFLEFCPYGSLSDFLDRNEILGYQQAAKLLYSIINGLNYLHEDFAQGSSLYKPSIAHRDFKSKNVLMKSPESCCIADFGHALIKVDEGKLDYGKYHHLQVGTIRYMAPEILRLDPSLNYRHFSTFALADLYQYGLIMWEICHRTALDVLHPGGSHDLPYDGVVPSNPTIPDMVKIVCEAQYRPPIYDKWLKHPVMKRFAELMVECWRPNPKARMETLGVKKKLKDLYDQIITSQHAKKSVHHNLAFNLIRDDLDKSKSSDITL